jgi:hypothetical protein
MTEEHRPEKRAKTTHEEEPLIKEEVVSPEAPVLSHSEVEEPVRDVTQLNAQLFEACEEGRDVGIETYLRDGASPMAINDHAQYPIHVWMYRMARKINLKKNHLERALETMDRLIPSDSSHVVNHLDDSYCSPLSLGIISDVRAYCVVKGLFNPLHAHKFKIPLTHHNVRSSPVTERLMSKYGATLEDVKLQGRNPWHYIASIIYSEKHASIPGFSIEKDTQLLIIPLALIIWRFQKVGRMNINERDAKGKTGLDILCERFDKEDVNMSEADFQVLKTTLIEAGCKESRHLKG